MPFFKKPIVRLGFILAIAFGFKVWLSGSGRVPFNADEAVVGLMARHIMQGERPIFFYGQAYMGSLDAFLVAGGFALFGEKVEIIRLIQMLLYMAFLVTTALLGRYLFNSWRTGLLASAFLMIPTVNMTLYTTASLGGYGEALLLGNLILLTGFWLIRCLDADQVNDWTLFLGWGLWGALVGLGLWVNGITLVYSVPMGLALLWKWVPSILKTRNFSWGIGFLAGFAGFAIGSCPWWFYAYQKGGQVLIHELLGGAVAVEQSSWIVRSINHLMSLVLLGGTASLGLRPPWEVRWLGAPLAPFILAFWIAAMGYSIKLVLDRSSYPHRLSMIVLWGIFFTLSAGFVFTSFGVDPSGRYFLPLAAPLACMGAVLVDQLKFPFFAKALIVGTVILFQSWGNIQAAMRFPPGITTQFDLTTVVDHRYDQDLMRFLASEDEYFGYTNYWVSYPLAFLSSEKMIFLPRLPYHQDLRYTPRDDRYPPYIETVQQSNRVAYILTPNENLLKYVRTAFKEKDITWQEKAIGDYRIFYRLSQPIRPEQIGLGKQREAQ